MGEDATLTGISKKLAPDIPSSVQEDGSPATAAGAVPRGEKTPSVADQPEPSGGVWINCSYLIVAAGLGRILENHARVHLGQNSPEDIPACIIFDTDGVEDLPEEVRRIRRIYPDTAILVFSLHLDFPVAWTALQAGARGFLHAGMQPHQVVRAVEMAIKGELVAPRKLLEYLVNEDFVEMEALSIRQREILDLLTEGLSNAQIAQRLYLSESTIKQHLRHTYKLLGVKNRTEAANFYQRAQSPQTSPSFRVPRV